MSTAIISAPTSSLRRTTIVAGAVGAAAATLAAATMRAAGVDLAVHGRIPLAAAFAQLTLAGAVLGGLLVAFLNRRSTLPQRRFIQIAVALTALSCLAPAAGGDDVASKIGLIAIHLLAAAIIAPVLARHTTR